MSSIGFIETKGLTGSLEAADAMLKAARVSLTRRREIGSALVTVMVEGELGAVQAAVDAGAAAAERLGQLVSAHVIARPFEDTEQWLGIAEPPKPSAKQGGAPVRRPSAGSRKQKAPHKADATPKSGETATDDKSAPVLQLLQKAARGMTPEELSAASGLDKKVLRVVLKNLLDQGRIEKVKNLYFPL